MTKWGQTGETLFFSGLRALFQSLRRFGHALAGLVHAEFMPSSSNRVVRSGRSATVSSRRRLPILAVTS